jgi:hypothetical protein
LSTPILASATVAAPFDLELEGWRFKGAGGGGHRAVPEHSCGGVGLPRIQRHSMVYNSRSFDSERPAVIWIPATCTIPTEEPKRWVRVTGRIRRLSGGGSLLALADAAADADRCRVSFAHAALGITVAGVYDARKGNDRYDAR